LLELAAVPAFLQSARQPYRLEAVRQMQFGQASVKVKASLAPATTAASPAGAATPQLLAAGSEGGEVHLVELSGHSRHSWHCSRLCLAAALTGQHASPVLAVAWGEGSTRLASSDKHGVVVVWQAQAVAVGPDTA
jgi:hypothetical protein